MIYLSGCTSPSYEDDIIDLGVGLLLQPGSYTPARALPFPAFAADNGCCKIVDGSPTLNVSWSVARWARMLGAIFELGPDRRRCLFALTPDWPCNHTFTLEMFRTYSPIVRGFGLPVAFAIQDGAEIPTVPWDDFDVAFLAGTTEWKCGHDAADFAIEARNRGKWVHMGRVNSWDRLDWASRIGCDSADGTFMKHGKPEEMVARMAEWLAKNAPRLTQRGAVA